MKLNRRDAVKMIAGAVPALASSRAFAASPQAAVTKSATDAIMGFTFDGVFSSFPIKMAELSRQSPTNLSAYSHLVMEVRMSSPQRLSRWVNTSHGPRSVSIIGFGQNVWLRASVPLQYFIGPGFERQRSGLGAEPAHELLLVFRTGTIRGPHVRRVDLDCDGVSTEQADCRIA